MDVGQRVRLVAINANGPIILFVQRRHKCQCSETVTPRQSAKIDVIGKNFHRQNPRATHNPTPIPTASASQSSRSAKPANNTKCATSAGHQGRCVARSVSSRQAPTIWVPNTSTSSTASNRHAANRDNFINPTCSAFIQHSSQLLRYLKVGRVTPYANPIDGKWQT